MKRRFDAPRIMSLATNLELMGEFKLLVTGFADSLIISKQVLKERSKEKKKFSIEALAADFLPNENTQPLHSAAMDIKVLNKLLEAIGITSEIIKSHTQGINEI